MLIRIGKFCLIALCVLLVNSFFAQEKTFKYVGVSKCKVCHITKKIGAQYKVWKNMKHSQAYATLASEKALAIAKEKGIENPQQSEKCLCCHVTAYGVDASLLGPKYTMEDGVGCEACHGPGSEYKSKKIQDGIAAGTIDPVSVGLIKPAKEVCIKCHNKKSPSFTGFDFDEKYAKIKHTRPQ